MNTKEASFYREEDDDVFKFLRKAKKIDVTQIENKIEDAVYAELKLLGFRKFGRTLYRFVSDDISKVINFQSVYRNSGFINTVHPGAYRGLPVSGVPGAFQRARKRSPNREKIRKTEVTGNAQNSHLR